MRAPLALCVLALAACGPKTPAASLVPAAAPIAGLSAHERAAEPRARRWFLVSTNDDYSMDPQIHVRTLEVVDVAKGRTAVVFRLGNDRPGPLDLATTKTVLLDARGTEQPILALPSGTIPSGGEAYAAYVFDTRDAVSGQLSMRLVVPDVKTIWPIVFTRHPR